MAVLALINARIEIATIDMSATIAAVELDLEGADLDTTNFGSGGWDTGIVGLGSGTVKLKFLQDFAATTVDDRVWGWFRTVQAFKIRPTSAAISATNPSYEGSFRVNKIQPITGSVGDLVTQDLTWPTSGVVTRAVA